MMMLIDKRDKVVSKWRSCKYIYTEQRYKAVFKRYVSELVPSKIFNSQTGCGPIAEQPGHRSSPLHPSTAARSAC